MCKLGDIIVIKEFKNEIGKIIKQHSFVVINMSLVALKVITMILFAICYVVFIIKNTKEENCPLKKTWKFQPI